ncbi:MAG: hypothetical protein MJ120_00600 [Clostridia bacterium]|nr:hypothetical protein [Clostridia bacterium]
MKKVLAIVLAMAMMLSFVPLMVSAFELSEGQMCFGVKEDIEANPGETVAFTVDLLALPNPEDIPEGVTDDGTLYIPFSVSSADIANGPLVGVELADEAKNVGAFILPFDENNDMSNEEIITGWIGLPSKYLFNKEPISLLKVNIAVSENWSVTNYVADSPISLNVSGGDDLFYSFFVPKDGDVVENAYEYQPEYFIFGIYGNGGIITAKPYQPKFFEKVWEWIKAKIRTLIDIDNIIDNLLLTKVFNAADWYDTYMLRKQAGKA